MARIDQTEDWRERHAPTISTFESLTIEAYGLLPEEFRALTGNLTIEIADFPTDEIFEDMALETPFDLLGLFEGPAASPSVFRSRRATCPIASRSIAGRSSTTGPKMTKRWATSLPMC